MKPKNNTTWNRPATFGRKTRSLSSIRISSCHEDKTAGMHMGLVLHRAMLETFKVMQTVCPSHHVLSAVGVAGNVI